MRLYVIDCGRIEMRVSNQVTSGAPDARNAPAIPVPCWLFQTEQGWMLFDTGCDPEGMTKNWPPARQENPYVCPPEQELTAQLALLGIRPSDIRCVVLSHLHLDHVSDSSRSEPCARAGLSGRGKIPYGTRRVRLPVPHSGTQDLRARTRERQTAVRSEGNARSGVGTGWFPSARIRHLRSAPGNAQFALSAADDERSRHASVQGNFSAAKGTRRLKSPQSILRGLRRKRKPRARICFYPQSRRPGLRFQSFSASRSQCPRWALRACRRR